MIQSLGSTRSNLFDIAAGGVRRSVDQANRAGTEIANGALDPEPFVQLIEAQAGVKANMVVLRTADEMLGTLLDRKA